VKITCSPAAGAGTRTSRRVTVKERPVLSDVRIEGVDRVSKKSVRDRDRDSRSRAAQPRAGHPRVERIDSLYEAHGYYLARVKPETTFVGGQIRLTFKVDEGRRVAVSGVRDHRQQEGFRRRDRRRDEDQAEGFLWFRKGAFDEDTFAGDLGDRLPALYGKRGYIDFQVVRDTMIVDRENGKALLEITVSEVRSTVSVDSRPREQAVLDRRGHAFLPLQRVHEIDHKRRNVEYRPFVRSNAEGRVRQGPVGASIQQPAECL
jgi:outer membrane protein insertion porin family